MHDPAEDATNAANSVVRLQIGLSAAKPTNPGQRIQIPLGARPELPSTRSDLCLVQGHGHRGLIAGLRTQKSVPPASGACGGECRSASVLVIRPVSERKPLRAGNTAATRRYYRHRDASSVSTRRNALHNRHQAVRSAVGDPSSLIEVRRVTSRRPSRARQPRPGRAPGLLRTGITTWPTDRVELYLNASGK